MRVVQERGVLIASEASVSTISIEVKALRIGTKQMTQSVFKQLKEEPLINAETGEFSGIPWGHINFHADCVRELAGEHLHIIWQKGAQLRKCTVSKNPEEDFTGARGLRQRRAAECQAATIYVYARILEGWSPDKWKGQDQFTFTIANRDFHLVAAPEIQWFWSGLPRAWDHYAKSAFSRLEINMGLDWSLPPDQHAIQRDASRQHRITRSRYWLQDYVDQHAWKGASACEIKVTKLDPAFKRTEDFQRGWRERYAALEQMDQLFIAV